MTEIIIKKAYQHYNKTLGMQINSKRQFDNELKRRGLCLQEEGDDRARRAIRDARKDYKIDKDTEKFIGEIRMTADNKGNVKLGDRALEFMKKKGVNFNRPDFKGLKGGFD